MKEFVQLEIDLGDDQRPAASASPVKVASLYPRFRFMGSKYQLLPWMHQVLSGLEFESALDAFSGSGCVAYLLKAMGKRVIANDFLQFAFHIANGLVANPGLPLTESHVEMLTADNPAAEHFIENTFRGVFFTVDDLRFLDNVWSNLASLPDDWRRSLALTALFRAALKRQPRGVFTVSSSQARKYDDGRRDLRMSLRQHFLESVRVLNRLVYDNGKRNQAICGDVFEVDLDPPPDLVYFDPPYVPRRDDNDYIKRYHFLEGLACYWRGVEIIESTKVKKIRKKFTPFSYRSTALEAFDRLFAKFADSMLVLSYSSNAYPDKDYLIKLMKRYKRRVYIEEKTHRYHFGTHSSVSAERVVVREYLIIGE